MKTDSKTRRVNFTKSAIEKLENPPTGRVYVYDTQRTGLALCLTSAGSRTWYLYRKVDGKPERIPLGKWPAMTVSDARDAADSHNGRIAEGVNPNDRRRLNRAAPKFGEAFDDFLDLPTRTKSKRPKSPKTKHDYQLLWNAHLEPWRHRRLAGITRTEIEKLHNRLAEENGHYQANRVLGLIKAIFNSAMDQHNFPTNPAARVRAFEEHSRDRFLQADEIPRFFAALDADENEKFRDLVRIALFTGQRRSNVCQMRWVDINLERAVWLIPQTKQGKPHAVPLPSEALEVLKRRFAVRHESGPVVQGIKTGSEYVFPGRHGKGHLKDPMRMWKDLLERAGITNLRIHDLRRSLGSWQTKTGASLTVVGKTLGHSQPQTTAIYSRLDLEPVREAMQTATSAIVGVVKAAEEEAKQKAKVGQGDE